MNDIQFFKTLIVPWLLGFFKGTKALCQVYEEH